MRMMTNYNELVDHLVSTMPSNSMENLNNKVHANSPYNDGWTREFYQEQIDKQESKSSAPFNTEAYRNYKELVDKEREKIDPNNITEAIYQLGYKIDTLLSKIISQLDTLIKEDFNPDKVTCSVDDKEVDCNTWEETN